VPLLEGTDELFTSVHLPCNMFSLSVSFSLTSERWTYDSSSSDDDSTPKASSRHQPAKITAPANTSLVRPPLGQPAISQAQQPTPTSSGPYHVDLSYASLSSQAQQIQQQARDRRRQQKHAPDADRLRPPETAIAKQRKARESATDARSLRLLESAVARKTESKTATRKQSISTTGEWSVISPPSSTALSRIHGLNGTPVSWDPSNKTDSIPHTPQSRIGYYMEKNRLRTDSDEKRLRRVQGQRPETEPQAQHDDIAIDDPAGAKGDEPGDAQAKKERYYLEDPFGSSLVQGSQEAEAQLMESMKEHRRQQIEDVDAQLGHSMKDCRRQQIENVHQLFGKLARRDQGLADSLPHVPGIMPRTSMTAAEETSPAIRSSVSSDKASSCTDVAEASPCVRLSRVWSGRNSGVGASLDDVAIGLWKDSRSAEPGRQSYESSGGGIAEEEHEQDDARERVEHDAGQDSVEYDAGLVSAKSNDGQSGVELGDEQKSAEGEQDDAESEDRQEVAESENVQEGAESDDEKKSVDDEQEGIESTDGQAGAGFEDGQEVAGFDDGQENSDSKNNREDSISKNGEEDAESENGQGDGDSDDERVVMEGLPKLELDEVESDWLLL